MYQHMEIRLCIAYICTLFALCLFIILFSAAAGECIAVTVGLCLCRIQRFVSTSQCTSCKLKIRIAPANQNEHLWLARSTDQTAHWRSLCYTAGSLQDSEDRLCYTVPSSAGEPEHRLPSTFLTKQALEWLSSIHVLSQCQPHMCIHSHDCSDTLILNTK